MYNKLLLQQTGRLFHPRRRRRRRVIKTLEKPELCWLANNGSYVCVCVCGQLSSLHGPVPEESEIGRFVKQAREETNFPLIAFTSLSRAPEAFAAELQV